ncbi:hypothetical protein SLS55_010056 [Diplodia seriata]|uniref:Uncharacterized protein n=1 Tax=Diplodia seriata TaxID=420778 RepID=A0ABR3C1R7_9PEZI
MTLTVPVQRESNEIEKRIYELGVAQQAIEGNLRCSNSPRSVSTLFAPYLDVFLLFNPMRLHVTCGWAKIVALPLPCPSKLASFSLLDCLLTLPTGRGDMPPADVDHELDDLVRKNIRLHEAISSLTDGSSSDSNMSITQGLELLSALRAASASSPDTISNGSRHASSKVQRNPKRNKLDHASNDDTDSIADSPKPTLSSGIKDRLGVGSSSKAGSRSTSVGAGRETSVKVEDGNDSMDSVKGKVDGLSLSTRHRHRKPSSKG